MRKTSSLVVLALFLAACGGGDDGAGSADRQIVVDNGGIDIVVETTTTVITADPTNDQSEPTFDATDDTIPENADDTPAALTMLDALGLFNSCLADEGVAFIGIPDASLEPTDPVNDQSYLDALSMCNNISGIGAAFQAFQTENDSLTTEEIEERNRGLVTWMDCMTGRGYTIDGVTSDERGLNTPNLVAAPEGKDIFDNQDMGECVGDALETAGDDEGGES